MDNHDTVEVNHPPVNEEVKSERSDEDFIFSFRRMLAINSLIVEVAISALPLFTIPSAFSFIAADIGAMAMSLAFAAVAPTFGALSDLIGRRFLGVMGACLVIAGLAVVGTAQNMPVAIAGMAVTGAGAGICQVIGISGILELVPLRRRGKYMAIVWLVYLPMAPTPGYAQIWSANLSWRMGAWVPIGFAVWAFVSTLFLYRPPPRVNSVGLNKRQTLARIDFVGSILSVSGIALVLTGLQLGGYTSPWRSVEVITTLTAGLALFSVFVIWELYAPYPMIAGRLFENKRIISLTLFILACGGAEFYAIASFSLLQAVKDFGPDPYTIAKLVIPFGFAFIIGICSFSWGLDILRGGREILLIASVLMTAGVGSLAAVTQNMKALAMGLSCIAGLGIGGVYIPAAVFLTTVAPDDLIGTIVGIGLSIRFIGGQIGYTILYNIFITKLTAVVPGMVGIAAIKAGLPPSEVTAFVEALVNNDTSVLSQLKGITPAVLSTSQHALRASYDEGFKLVFLASIGFGGAAIIASLFLGDVRRYKGGAVVDIH